MIHQLHTRAKYCDFYLPSGEKTLTVVRVPEYCRHPAAAIVGYHLPADVPVAIVGSGMYAAPGMYTASPRLAWAPRHNSLAIHLIAPQARQQASSVVCNTSSP